MSRAGRDIIQLELDYKMGFYKYLAAIQLWMLERVTELWKLK